jgi:hypothetical protein
MIHITETLLELPFAARRLGIPEATMRSWIDAGLEQVPWNGRVLTSLDAIERFRRKRESAAVVDQEHGAAACQTKVA